MKWTGYKIVHREGDHAVSLATGRDNRRSVYSLKPGAILQGPTYLGTSKAYAVDYFSTGSENPTDPEEMLLTVEYDDRDILKGNPDEPDQLTGGAEVIVRKCRLKSADSLRKEQTTGKEASMEKLSSYLDRIADALEERGFLKEAFELDVISNTLDLMTTPARASQREIMEELGFASQYIKKTSPQVAMQAFASYWGSEHGPALYEIARQQSLSGPSQPLVQKWDAALQKAKRAKATGLPPQPAEADPFLSPAERAQTKKPVAPVEDPVFTRG